MDRLQFSGSGVFDVACLGENLKNSRPEALSRGVIPDGHLRVPTSTVIQVIFPAFVGKRLAEDPVMVPDKQIQKVS